MATEPTCACEGVVIYDEATGRHEHELDPTGEIIRRGCGRQVEVETYTTCGKCGASMNPHVTDRCVECRIPELIASIEQIAGTEAAE